MWGLACMSILRLRVALPDGSVQNVTPDSKLADLFWVAKGGGTVFRIAFFSLSFLFHFFLSLSSLSSLSLLSFTLVLLPFFLHLSSLFLSPSFFTLLSLFFAYSLLKFLSL